MEVTDRGIVSTRLENQIKDTQAKLEKKKAEIIQIQAGAQAGATAGQQPPVKA